MDREVAVTTLVWHLIRKDHMIGNIRTMFQVDWTSTSSKTTLRKNFNQKLLSELFAFIFYVQWTVTLVSNL